LVSYLNEGPLSTPKDGFFSSIAGSAPSPSTRSLPSTQAPYTPVTVIFFSPLYLFLSVTLSNDLILGDLTQTIHWCTSNGDHPMQRFQRLLKSVGWIYLPPFSLFVDPFPNQTPFVVSD